MIKKVEITMADPYPFVNFVNFICFNSASKMHNTFIMVVKTNFRYYNRYSRFKRQVKVNQNHIKSH